MPPATPAPAAATSAAVRRVATRNRPGTSCQACRRLKRSCDRPRLLEEQAAAGLADVPVRCTLCRDYGFATCSPHYQPTAASASTSVSADADARIRTCARPRLRSRSRPRIGSLRADEAKLGPRRREGRAVRQLRRLQLAPLAPLALLPSPGPASDPGVSQPETGQRAKPPHAPDGRTGETCVHADTSLSQGASAPPSYADAEQLVVPLPILTPFPATASTSDLSPHSPPPHPAPPTKPIASFYLPDSLGEARCQPGPIDDLASMPCDPGDLGPSLSACSQSISRPPVQQLAARLHGAPESQASCSWLESSYGAATHCSSHVTSVDSSPPPRWTERVFDSFAPRYPPPEGFLPVTTAPSSVGPSQAPPLFPARAFMEPLQMLVPSSASTSHRPLAIRSLLNNERGRAPRLHHDD